MARARMFRVDNITENSFTVVLTEQEFRDETFIRTVGQDLLSLLFEEKKALHVVIDFSKVWFFTSYFTNTLVVFGRKLSKQDGQLVLTGLNPTMKDQVLGSDLVRYAQFAENPEKALATMPS